MEMDEKLVSLGFNLVRSNGKSTELTSKNYSLVTSSFHLSGWYSRQQSYSSTCDNTCDFLWFDCQFLSSHACYKQYKA